MSGQRSRIACLESGTSVLSNRARILSGLDSLKASARATPIDRASQYGLPTTLMADDAQIADRLNTMATNERRGPRDRQGLSARDAIIPQMRHLRRRVWWGC